MLQRVYRPLLRSVLFEHLQTQQLIELLGSISYRVLDYQKGEYIYNCHQYRRELGIVIAGKVEVQKHLPSGKKIIMNQLGPSEPFGMVALFEDRGRFVTDLMAKEATSVFFVGEEQLLQLFHTDQNVLTNYLRHMNRKIEFLNQRIECFTNEQTKERVLEYLEQMRSLQNGFGQVTLAYNKSNLADYLGISRASLYRILHSLEEEGYLSMRGRKIYFLKDACKA